MLFPWFIPTDWGVFSKHATMSNRIRHYLRHETVSVPEYLTYFFRKEQPLFHVLCDLEEDAAEEILKHDVLWRGDGTYLTHRKQHERTLRELFIAKGGQPVRQYPIYMILGDSPGGPHDLNLEYAYNVTIPFSIFTPEDVSFTYPDSLYEIPLDDLGRLHLNRNIHPVVYRWEELESVITRYSVYEYNNHYVEAQVWNDAPLQAYASKLIWQRCHSVNLLKSEGAQP